jgi:hypothetical protein
MSHCSQPGQGEAVERCAQQISWARQVGERAYDSLMRLVRGIISRFRQRLQTFQLDLHALVGMGYLVVRLPGSQEGFWEQRSCQEGTGAMRSRFQVYPLPGLYPEQERLVLDTQERILTRLGVCGG